MTSINNGKKSERKVKELGVKRMGRKPAIKAENKEAVSSFVIFFARAYARMVKVENRRLGNTCATNSKGKNRSKNAAT